MSFSARKKPEWLKWPQTIRLLQAFEMANQPLQFVGGCVRDSLLANGRPVSDIDAATPATPQEMVHSLEAAAIRVIPTGIDHGTITALIDGQAFQITTLRRDKACDGRHAEVTYTDNWQEDAMRRDFTINALYMDGQGQLYDPTGNGLADLKQGLVRFIGQAEERVEEDYLRILRFFRFLATHGQAPADREGLAACAKYKEELKQLAGERIQQEMMKLLAAPKALWVIRQMQETGIPEEVIPGSPVSLSRLERLPEEADALTRLAALLIDTPEQAVWVAERWKLSVADRNALLAALQLLDLPLTEKGVKASIHHAGAQTTRRRLLLASSPPPAALVALTETWEPPVFPVSGKDLLALGFTPGKAMGETLRQLETDWEAQDYLPDKETLLEKVKPG